MQTPAARLSLATATRVTWKWAFPLEAVNAEALKDVNVYVSNTGGQIPVEPTKDCQQ